MNKILKPLSIIRILAEKGFRIFSSKDVKDIAQSLGLRETYVPQLLHRYAQEGIINHLYKDTYALNQSLLSGPPLTEYEIGNHLVSPSALCCWTAFVIHQLTDQVLQTVFVMTPYKKRGNSSKKIFEIGQTTYKIIRVQEKDFFGYEKKFITENPLTVTDLEKTLIDGVMHPQYCGGFREVMDAFEKAWERVDQDKLIMYGKKMTTAVLKRIGWICDNLNLDMPYLKDLENLPCSSFYKLDLHNENTGPWCRKWNLRENI